MMTAMPPVACTAMNAELVKNEPASVPNRYPYGPDSGLTPASTAAARPSGTLSTPSTRPAMASSRRVPRPTRNRTLTDYRPTEFLVGAGGHRHRQTHIARSGETWRARLRQRRTSPARLVTQQHSIDRGRHRPVGTDRETAGVSSRARPTCGNSLSMAIEREALLAAPAHREVARPLSADRPGRRTKRQGGPERRVLYTDFGLLTDEGSRSPDEAVLRRIRGGAPTTASQLPGRRPSG